MLCMLMLVRLTPLVGIPVGPPCGADLFLVRGNRDEKQMGDVDGMKNERLGNRIEYRSQLCYIDLYI